MEYNWILFVVFTLGSNVSAPVHVGETLYPTQAECKDAASKATFAVAGNENVRAVTWCGATRVGATVKTGSAGPIVVVKPPTTVGGP
jgi:hypothetical protein